MASGIEVGRLYASLKLDKSEFERGLNGSGGTLGRFAGVAKVAAVGVVGAIAGIGVAAGKLAADFQANMANVHTLLGPGSEAEARIDALGEDVKALSVETGKTLDDLSGGLYQVVSAFGDTADSAEILGIAAKASSAGLAETTDAVDLLSAVTKGYGDTSAGAVQKASDLAFQTVKLGQTTFPELAASMGKAIPIANALGVSQEELFGAMATLTGVTGNTAEVSTQLKAVFQAIVAGNPAMIKALKDMGFSSGEAAVESLGLQGVLEGLEEQTGGSTGKLKELYGSTEALSAVLALTGPQADAFTEKTAAMASATGANVETFARLREAVATTSDRIAAGEASFGEYGDVLGEFRNDLGLSREQITTFVSDLEKVGEQQAFENLAAGLDGLTGATEEAFEIQQSTVESTMERINAAIGVLLVNLGEKLLPIVQSVLDWVLANWPQISATFEAVFDAIGAAISWVVDTIFPMFTGSTEDIGGGVLPALGEAFDFMTNEVIPRFAAIFDWIVTNIVPPVSEAIGAIAEVVLPIASAAFAAVADVVAAAWPTIERIAGVVGEAVRVAVTIIAEVIKATAPVVRWLAETIFPLLAGAAKVLWTVIDVAFTAIGVIWDTAWDVAKTIANGIGKVFENLGTAIGKVWDGVTGTIKGAINFIIGIVNGFIRAINGIRIDIPGIDTPFGKVAEFHWGGLNLGLLPKLAIGTEAFPGGWALLGEHGPELAKLPAGTQVRNAGDSRGILAGAGGRQVNYNLTVQGSVEGTERGVLKTLAQMAAIDRMGMEVEPA